MPDAQLVWESDDTKRSITEGLLLWEFTHAEGGVSYYRLAGVCEDLGQAQAWLDGRDAKVMRVFSIGDMGTRTEGKTWST